LHTRRPGSLETGTIVPVREVSEVVLETIDGVVRVPGAELHSTALLPPAPRTAIFLIQDHALAPSPFVAELALAWARAGHATFRVDKRTGGDGAAMDYVTEIADLATASVGAATCARDRDIPLVAFAHGTGATMLTELDQPWGAALVFEAHGGGALAGGGDRSAAFRRQLASVDPADAWARMRAPLYLGGTADADRIAAWVAGPTTIAHASRSSFGDLALAWLDAIVRC
jgi:hypothetical protein